MRWPIIVLLVLLIISALTLPTHIQTKAGMGSTNIVGGFDPAGIASPGLSFVAPASQRYVGAIGNVSVDSLNIIGDFYPNGSAAAGMSLFIQLGASVYSSTAGAYWSVVGLVLNQSVGGSFAFGLIDQVWNETYACYGPGTQDQMENVSGRGGIVVSFPGCFGTHYEYSSPALGIIKPPFRLSLGEYLTTGDGALGLVYNYTLLSPSGGFGGLVDKVTIDRGLKPAPATLIVGGISQLGLNYTIQLAFSAPIPLEVAAVNASSGVLSLAALSPNGTVVFPTKAVNYGPVALSGVDGVSVYTDYADPNRPVATFSGGTLHPSYLWPLTTRSEYSLSQTPGGPIVISANFTYYDPKIGVYLPLPQVGYTLSVNGSAQSVFLSNGSVSSNFYPPTYGYYSVDIAYPQSVAFGTPHISFTMAVMALASNATSVASSILEVYPDGYTANVSLEAGHTLFLLIPPGGLTLVAPNTYKYSGVDVRFGFVGWRGLGAGVQSTRIIQVSRPVNLTYCLGTQYFVSVTQPGGQPKTMWVSDGALLNLTTPKYIYVNVNLERLAFVNWSTGAAGNTTIVVHSPMNITANYVVEYKVYLSTPTTTLINAYYPAGSVVTVRVPATLGGSWLYPNAFQGWSGTVNSHSRTLKLVVTGPIVDQAVYTVTSSRVSGLEALFAVLIGALVAFIAQKKKL
ncbi:MAG: hypothetical protein QXH56_01440 [Thermoprotei archaeon]